MNSSFRMNSLGQDYRALVIGASGALGAAFCEWLNEDPGCSVVRELGRNSAPGLDLEKPDSIASAAAELAEEAPYQLILHAAGLLHREDIKPEKVTPPLKRMRFRQYSKSTHSGLHWFCATSCPCLTLVVRWQCFAPRSAVLAITVWAAGMPIAPPRLR